jgi:hypothetical protein
MKMSSSYINRTTVISDKKCYFLIPRLGKEELDFRRACPGWAEQNWISDMLAQAGQRRIEFQTCLPRLGREELDFRRACSGSAKKN